MKSLIGAIATGSMFALISSAAMAQQTPIERIFPQSDYSVSFEGDSFEDGIRRYTDVKIGSGSSALAIDTLTFTPLLGGDISMQIDTMRIAPVGEDRPSFFLSDMTVQFSDWPSGDDALCAWGDVISQAEVGLVGVSYRDAVSPLLAIHLSDVALEARDASKACWFDGLLAATSVKVHLRNGASFEAEGIRSDIGGPLSREAAARGADREAHMKAAIERFEAWEKGAAPVFGFSDVAASGRAQATSLEGPLALARSAGFLSQAHNAGLDLMQALNAATLIDGQFQISSPQMRIYSAGVFPPAVVANFSRAGMSTLTGSASLQLDLDKGAIGLAADASLSGIADVKTRMSADLHPYNRTKLKLAQSGALTPAQSIPELFMRNLEIDYQDRGLDVAVQDISGVPLGRVIQEYGRLYSQSQPEAFRAPTQRMSAWLSTYFRLVASGEKTQLTMQPQGEYNLAEIFYRLLTTEDLSRGIVTVNFSRISP